MSLLALGTALSAQVELAPPVELKAGDTPVGNQRLYPSPSFYDVNGDGLQDIVVGDLIGKVTFALRQKDGSFAAEQDMKDAEGKAVEFDNW